MLKWLLHGVAGLKITWAGNKLQAKPEQERLPVSFLLFLLMNADGRGWL